ncbi:MAG TPA: hypothetical protein VKT29_01235 [Terriglobales bacterium]|nr:hypothetical protein [Terriglobales bacterium]
MAVYYDVTLDGTVTPARSLEVQVALPAGKQVRNVSRSGTLSDMKPLEYRTVVHGNSQTLRLKLEAVNIYGLADIELQ